VQPKERGSPTSVIWGAADELLLEHGECRDAPAHWLCRSTLLEISTAALPHENHLNGTVVIPYNIEGRLQYFGGAALELARIGQSETNTFVYGGVSMNESRRKLLQRGLMAALLMPSMLFTPIGLGETSIPVEQWYWYPGHTFCMKSTGKETGGTTTWMLAEAPPRGGVPFHKHLYEDESFYVIDGLFELSVGERSVSGGPGTYAYGPATCRIGGRTLGLHAAAS
jgi:Cupin domain